MERSTYEGTGNSGAMRLREDGQTFQYARRLIEASLDPLVTISPEDYRQVFAKSLVTDYLLTIRHKDGCLTEVQRGYYAALKWEP